MAKYEMVVGLETHVELSTKTKIFCGCTTAFGAKPNTNCCPICIGLPGTLPKLNRQVVHYAIKAGLATHCNIAEDARMDRKNYVYPDLPKAYQISQYDKPLCYGGYITLRSGKKIRITRIHIEEDAGKLVHDRGDTYVDYNRGGVPLIEIVSEPDIRSIEEAREYLENLQLIMKYIGVSDCKMQEGSLRCDVNLSLRPVGSDEMGTRAEIKNMNSFSNMEKAMQYEYERQAELLDNGEAVEQETRRFDVGSGCTESMRGKEDAQDYRYFREPDLVPIHTSPQTIQQLLQQLPELPDSRTKRYLEYGIAPADVASLVKYQAVARYFDEACQGVENPKTVSNLIVGQLFRRMPTDEEKENCTVAEKTTPAQLRELVQRLESGKIRMNLAKTTLETMLDTGKSPSQLLSAEDLSQVDDTALTEICRQVIADNPGNVADFLGGKEKALQPLIGAVMRATKGKADARTAQKLLRELMACAQ